MFTVNALVILTKAKYETRRSIWHKKNCWKHRFPSTLHFYSSLSLNTEQMSDFNINVISAHSLSKLYHALHLKCFQFGYNWLLIHSWACKALSLFFFSSNSWWKLCSHFLYYIPGLQYVLNLHLEDIIKTWIRENLL